MAPAAAPGSPAPTVADPSDKSPERIRDMFARVAPGYDRLNHLLSVSLDRWWRRRSARAVGRPGEPVLDLCCGTGDQAIALHRRGARVAAADFCLPMLALSRPKFARLRRRPPAPLAADALALPFPDRGFAAVTVSFGVRNVVDLEAAIREMHRVLRPGGRLAILEFALPENRLLRSLYLFYFHHVLPRIGRLLSRHDSAYTYLPESVSAFPQRRAFLDVLRTAGFSETHWKDLSAGTVCLYTARRDP